MPIRLIAIDIDGTLLDSRWQLPPANLAAIAAAVDGGIEVVLATGRRFDFAVPVLKRVAPVQLIIVSGGAVTKHRDGQTLARRTMPLSTASRVLASTRGFRRDIGVVFDRVGANQLIFERIAWDDPRHQAHFEQNRHALGEASPLESCLTEEPIQVVAAGGVARMRALVSTLEALRAPQEFELALTEYPARDLSIVDVTAAGVSKGSALTDLARARGLSRAEVMAIGDNHNDRPMLEAAGLPVVMGNAAHELKTSEWLVTASNDNEGVAKAIRKYVLDERTRATASGLSCSAGDAGTPSPRFKTRV
jgi:Cof subfamily protein (haloacid dehalogenase superfamily)